MPKDPTEYEEDENPSDPIEKKSTMQDAIPEVMRDNGWIIGSGVLIIGVVAAFAYTRPG